MMELYPWQVVKNKETGELGTVIRQVIVARKKFWDIDFEKSGMMRFSAKEIRKKLERV